MIERISRGEQFQGLAFEELVRHHNALFSPRRGSVVMMPLVADSC